MSEKNTLEKALIGMKDEQSFIIERLCFARRDIINARSQILQCINTPSWTLTDELMKIFLGLGDLLSNPVLMAAAKEYDKRKAP